MIGKTLSHFKITAKLGEGGMGEVYRAEDTKLGREVAIKVLPEAFVADPERLARFEREATVLASLNHPNIAGIYEVGEDEEVHFLAMELAPGEDLTALLGRGPIPVVEALPIALQIVEALEAAHERGIVHRDLKPANVKISAEGQVKVLDFGLAKATETDSKVESRLSMSPTLTAQMTGAGVILGTAAYMSPEQARGQEAGSRSDIWSFGVVLAEMLSGTKTFAGDTVSDTLASVLRDDLDLDRLVPTVPASIRRLLDRCLQRDPRHRLQHIGDARLDIEDALAHPEERGTSTLEAGDSRPSRVLLAAALLVGAVLASAGWWLLGRGEAPESGRAPARLSVQVPEGFYPGEGVRISPDGGVIAYIAESRWGTEEAGAQLLVRNLEDGETRVVPSSDGGLMFDFSPDGKWLAFVAPIARQSSRLRLFKVPVSLDSPPLAVADWDAAWGRTHGILWHADGDLLAVTAAGPQKLIRISAESGTVGSSVEFSLGSQGTHYLRDLLPGGLVLGSLSTWDGGYRIDPIAIDPVTGDGKVIVRDGAMPRFSPTGHLLFSRQGNLLAAPFDASRGEITSGPVSIAAGLRADIYSFESWFDIARNGTLVYLPGGEFGGGRRLVLAGAEEMVPWSLDELRFPEVDTPIRPSRLDASADGRWLALTLMNEDGLFEIWGSEVGRTGLRRLVGFPTLDCDTPVWSGDAAFLAMGCVGDLEADGIYVLNARSSEEPKLALALDDGDPTARVLGISPDGTELLVLWGQQPGNQIIQVRPGADGAVERRTLLTGSGIIKEADLNMSGSKLVYVSNETGRLEVSVRARSGDGSLGPAVPVANARSARWRVDSSGQDELYFWTDENELRKLRVDSALNLSEATLVMDMAEIESEFMGWDLLPDGRVLAVVRGEDERPQQNLSVVLGFDTVIESLAPSR